MFAADIEENKEVLTSEIKDKTVCVIGGAGSIGSSFIKVILRFEPKSVVVVDLNENGLAELVRDVRSTEGLFVQMSSAATPQLRIQFLSVFYMRRRVSTSLPTSPLTSTCVLRKINIPFRRLSRITTSRPRS